MTTKPTIDGVSRELLERLSRLLYWGEPEYNARQELRELLDAQMHEHEWDINAEGTATVCYCGAKSSDAPEVEQGPLMITLVDHKIGQAAYLEHIKAQQAAIAQLEAENSDIRLQAGGMEAEIDELKARINSLFDAVSHGDEAHREWLKSAICAHFSGYEMPAYIPSTKDRELAELKARIAELEAEDLEWSAMQQRLGDENLQLKACIAELERGRGEAVAEISNKFGDPEAFAKRELILLVDIQKLPISTKLYIAPPAPVAAVLPRYTCIGNGGDYELLGLANGAGTLKGIPHMVYRNADGVMFARETEDFLLRMACLDATAALNGIKT